jgi:hypothetical protein
METKIIMLPLDEVTDILGDYFKCVQKIAVVIGDDPGIAVEYYDDRDKQVHMKVIRPIPASKCIADERERGFDSDLGF